MCEKDYKMSFLRIKFKEKWLSGRRRTIGNRVYVISVPWVQIPFSPPKNTAEKDTFSAVFFYPSRRLGISSPHEVWWISSALLGCISSRISVYLSAT